ncbi:INO80 complex subunit D-like [Fagus crenata]
MASASKHQNPSTTTPKTPIALDPTTTTLSRASHLTRQELLRRRSHHLKQLSKCYRAHYWALMDQLKLQYKHYYWKFGVSPFQQDAAESNERDIQTQAANSEACDNNNNNYNNQRCVFVACKQKAMPLTSFCHLHILSDSKQKLYKPCTYVTRSVGPLTCGKPILRSTVPSLCSNHFQKAQKHVTRTLKQAGRK